MGFSESLRTKVDESLGIDWTNIIGATLFIYDAKNGTLYEYNNLRINVHNEQVAFTRIKGVDSERRLPGKEFDIYHTGSCFGLWFSKPTVENRNKAIETLKKFIKDYGIRKTGEVTKEFNRKCGYYRTLIKNSEKLDGNGAIVK